METAGAPFGKGLLRPLEDFKLVNHRIRNPRLLDKSRAAYRRACKRDPSLSPLRPVPGKVEVKGAVRVVLPTVGGKVVYTAALSAAGASSLSPGGSRAPAPLRRRL